MLLLVLTCVSVVVVVVVTVRRGAVVAVPLHFEVTDCCSRSGQGLLKLTITVAVAKDQMTIPGYILLYCYTYEAEYVLKLGSRFAILIYSLEKTI